MAIGPTRLELGARVAELRLRPVELMAPRVGPFSVAGAWQMTSDDARVGGISALAAGPDGLIAITDSGVVIRFPKLLQPLIKAEVDELPDGPGNPRYKRSRDSEALLADPLGRGWWVAFETFHELWLYDRKFTSVLGRIRFGADRWRRNGGIEGLASDGNALLAFPESGESVVRVSGGDQQVLGIANQKGRISDAARLPGGQLAVIHRDGTISGFSNMLSIIARFNGAYRVLRSYKLPVGRLDNVEAIAVERLPNGRYRLWLMTDDNFQRPFRTLLIALEA